MPYSLCYVYQYNYQNVRLKLLFIAANAIWNNMLRPPNRKLRNWGELFQEFACPTLKSPYIATLQNYWKPTWNW